MRALYGPALQERYRAVDRLIPDGASVVELGCGCGFLYEHYLRQRGIRYHGIDLLPAMIPHLAKLGAHVEQGDVRTMPIPSADYVVMLGALYHFHPDESCLLQKMAAAGTGIVLEPVRNFSQSGSRCIAWLARWMSFIPGTSSDYRLTPERLDLVLAQSGVAITSRTEVLGGRYLLIEFRTSQEPTDDASR